MSKNKNTFDLLRNYYKSLPTIEYKEINKEQVSIQKSNIFNIKAIKFYKDYLGETNETKDYEEFLVDKKLTNEFIKGYNEFKEDKESISRSHSSNSSESSLGNYYNYLDLTIDTEHYSSKLHLNF